MAITTSQQTLSDRLAVIRERIADACRRSRRPVDSVELIAVTKLHPAETLQECIDCGVKHLGENRVGEIIEKVPRLQGDFTMHCIGHLQTNKVAKVLPFIQMLQSVDRVRLVETLERHLPEGTSLPVLVEVNTSGETTKNGCSAQECRALIERMLSGGRLVPSGYMTIGPLDGGERQVREAFSLLRATAESNRDLITAPELSMGMSGDFEWAIEEGASMVRIGTLLVGERC
ncbi:MAG: YggS family pyridoxal phosphate-dependent enzyme [Chitinispirillaceae bacterium]|nr:YggS family pyridoxal phosphate-dependent enzyme [Chitinispirillaceae bacterium]